MLMIFSLTMVPLVKKGTDSVKSPSDAKKVIQADSKIIAKQAAKEMASDVLRWEKEGSSERHYNLKGMNKQQLENFFEKKIEANISKGSQHDPDLWDNNSFNFVMDDVIEEYGMPVDFDYDWKGNMFQAEPRFVAVLRPEMPNPRAALLTL